MPFVHKYSIINKYNNAIKNEILLYIIKFLPNSKINKQLLDFILKMISKVRFLNKIKNKIIISSIYKRVNE
jgi:hypothetical protein